MKIEVLKSETYNNVATLPKAATERSTGYDIIATSDPEIVGEKTNDGYSRIDYIQYKTNLKIAVQKEQKSWSGFGVELIDYDVLAMPRSSVSKYNLVLANSVGLIDADYRGEVLVRFKYIWQPEDYSIQTKVAGDGTSQYSFLLIGNPNLDKIYKKGDKICQLKITKVEHAEFTLVDVLDTTKRGEGGFGSTDQQSTNTPIVPDSTLADMIKNYKKNPVYTPEKKYSDLMKERENNL